MLKKSFFILLITFALGNFAFADQKDKWSISIGQFDVNDTIDSSELRLELLYENNFYTDQKLRYEAFTRRQNLFRTTYVSGIHFTILKIFFMQ